jgi:biopolymer transport protein ExbB
MPRLNELFAAGGIIMVPLIGFSIAVIALAVERFVFWYRVKRRQHPVIRDVLKRYPQKPDLAIETLKRNLDLSVVRIFLEALSLKDANPEAFRLALNGAIQAELPLLKRFSPIFETVVGLAPLLGLLGTIMGLIRSFSSLNLGEIGGTKTLGVTAGISEALVATATRACFKTLESPPPPILGASKQASKSPNLGGLKPFGHTRKGGRSFSNEAIRSFKTQPSLTVAAIALLLANTFRAFYQRQLGLIEEYSVQLELIHRRAHRVLESSYA